MHLTGRKLSAWASQRLASGVTPAGVNCDLRHIRAALNWAAHQDPPLIESAPTLRWSARPGRCPGI